MKLCKGWDELSTSTGFTKYFWTINCRTNQVTPTSPAKALRSSMSLRGNFTANSWQASSVIRFTCWHVSPPKNWVKMGEVYLGKPWSFGAKHQSVLESSPNVNRHILGNSEKKKQWLGHGPAHPHKKKHAQVANIIKDPALQHLHMSWFFGHSVLKHIKSSPYVKVTSGSSYARDARLPKEISKHEHTLQLYN